MKRIAFLLSVLAFFSVSCVKNQENALKTAFPQCSEEPGIGATSGVKCDYHDESGEWRISFWTGWGDCPSGCINMDYYAFYKVDKKGQVFECDKDFKNENKISADDKIEPPKPPPSSKIIHIK